MSGIGIDGWKIYQHSRPSLCDFISYWHLTQTTQFDYTCKAYKVQYGLGFKKYYLFTAYIFTKKQAKYVLQKNKYSLVLEIKYDNPKTMT